MLLIFSISREFSFPSRRFVANIGIINNVLSYSTSDNKDDKNLPSNPFEQLIKEKKESIYRELLAKQNPFLKEKNEIDYNYLSTKVESLSNQVKLLQKKFNSLCAQPQSTVSKFKDYSLDTTHNKSLFRGNSSVIDKPKFEHHLKSLQKIWNDQIRSNVQPYLVTLKKNVLESYIAVLIDKKIKDLYKYVGKLSLLLNDITGYAVINTLKEKITRLESQISDVTKLYKMTKQNYTNLIDERNSNSKRINELLIRKNNWSNEDLQRFTELYTNEHKLDQRVTQLTNKVKELEDEQETLQDLLIKEISKKNNEEYLWNIKMRILSSWVTVGLMILNILILLFTHWILEPLKIKRTLTEFEKQFEFEEKLNHLEFQIQNLSNNSNNNNNNVGKESTFPGNQNGENAIEQIQEENLCCDESSLSLQQDNSPKLIKSLIVEIYNDPKNWKTYIGQLLKNCYSTTIEAYNNPNHTYVLLKTGLMNWINSEYNVSNLDMVILIASVCTAVKFLFL